MLIGRIAASCCLWLATTGLLPGELLVTSSKVDRYRHETWRIDSGLPDNEVQALCQTQDGYLWIGTRSGLARFDGLRFTIYNRFNTPALENDDVLALAEDPEGNLWIGLREGIVCKRQATFIPYPAERDFGPILNLVAASDGEVYAGHTYGLIGLGSASAWPSPTLPAVLDQPTSALFEHPAGQLWIGNRGQINILNLTDTSIARDARHPLGTNQLPRAFAADLNGRFWMIATLADDKPEFNQLWELQADGWVCPNPTLLNNGGRNVFLTPSSSGGLWMPDNQAGLINYRAGEFTRHPMPFEDYPICALEDREGNLWVGTESEGLHCFYRPRLETITTADGLPDPSTWALMQGRDGSMWIGTSGGLTQLNKAGMTHLTDQDGWTRRRVRALAEDPSGRIWVGTSSSLDCVLDGQIRSHRFPGPWWNTKVRVLLVTRENTLWVGTAGGLYGVNIEDYLPSTAPDSQPVLLTPHTVLSSTNGLAVHDIRALLEGRDGALWIGTGGGGLYRWKGASLQHFTSTNGLADTHVWAFHEEADGTLWIGTENGLHRRRNDTIVVFNRKHGLAENTINEILEDNNGTLWLSGNRGVYAVRKTDLEKVASGRLRAAECAAYNEIDGMPSNETNGQISQPAGWKCREGKLWFPTTRGVVIIDPNRAAEQLPTPTVIIEQVRARGRPVFGDDAPPTRGPIQLPPEEGDFIQITYTATGLTDAGRLRFSYRLLGLDRDWIEAGKQRQISYANLPPGAYTFQVIAGTPQDVWTQTGATLMFQIEPRLHQTASFKVTLASLIAFTVVGIVCLFLGKARQRNHIAQQTALLNQRTELTRDLHDELGANLAQICRLATTTETHPTQTTHQTIASLAQEATQHLNDLVWIRNPRFDTLADLVLYLREYAAKYLNETGLRVQFDFPADPDERPVSSHFRRHAVPLLKESLNNILRHAHAKSVRLALSINLSFLTLEIADDGCGLDPILQRPHGQGLHNMRQRAESLGGSVEITAAPGQGTRLTFRLPIR